jgi:hypothetical protein
MPHFRLLTVTTFGLAAATFLASAALADDPVKAMVRVALLGETVEGEFIPSAMSISIGAGTGELVGTAYGDAVAGFVGTAVGTDGSVIVVNGEKVEAAGSQYETDICIEIDRENCEFDQIPGP